LRIHERFHSIFLALLALKEVYPSWVPVDIGGFGMKEEEKHGEGQLTECGRTSE